MAAFHIERDAACPFSASIEFAQTYFDAVPGGRLLLALTLRAGPFVISLRRRVVAETQVGPDRTDAARRHDAISLRFHAAGGLPFPHLAGELTARPFAPGTRLRLDIAYTPPLAFLGRFIDAAIGRFVAERIARALLDEVAGHIEASYAAFCRKCALDAAAAPKRSFA